MSFFPPIIITAYRNKSKPINFRTTIINSRKTRTNSVRKAKPAEIKKNKILISNKVNFAKNLYEV